MIQQIAADPALPISGIGGISDWRDAAEFILLGAGTLQVCTAAMHYGFRIVEDMLDGLSNWMDSKGFRTLDDFRGLSLPRVVEWKNLDLNYKIVARIHPEKCIGCDLCYTACLDGAHQCIHMDRESNSNGGGHRTPAQVEAESSKKIAVTPIAKLDGGFAGVLNNNGGPYATPLARIPRVDEEECVGCNLCALVCPVEGCIAMERIDTGRPPESWEQRMATLGKGGECE
jgi:dihydropyrimidine dehydrogenase (NAD+) subunit PreA